MKFQPGFSSTAEGQPRLQLVFGEFLKPLYELVGEWQLAAGIEHKRPECRLGRRASVLSASIHCGDVMITESRRIDLLRESAHFNPKTRFCGKRYPATTIFSYWMDRQARFCARATRFRPNYLRVCVSSFRSRSSAAFLRTPRAA
uniref:Uncharacterized protein n=1 Tax=Rhodosorus marinus TaxID=101924 RepID=A0A7S2ZBD7_9RHOD|mmetsp:Transcript_12874/g.51435  ORF Transcript_12874/g.51435 Transcript_12874/m.51435 type:complete len:145 (+) Transcript_12874:255-689(+)